MRDFEVPVLSLSALLTFFTFAFLISAQYSNKDGTMVLSGQFALFSVVCLPFSLSSDIKSPKDEIDDIRRLLRDQNERILKLESENLALKRDNADLREQVVGVAKKEGLLQNDVVHLRRQLSEIKEQLMQNKTQNSKITEPPNDTSQRTDIKNRKDVDFLPYRNAVCYFKCNFVLRRTGYRLAFFLKPLNSNTEIKHHCSLVCTNKYISYIY